MDVDYRRRATSQVHTGVVIDRRGQSSGFFGNRSAAEGAAGGLDDLGDGGRATARPGVVVRTSVDGR